MFVVHLSLHVAMQNRTFLTYVHSHFHDVTSIPIPISNPKTIPISMGFPWESHSDANFHFLSTPLVDIRQNLLYRNSLNSLYLLTTKTLCKLLNLWYQLASYSINSWLLCLKNPCLAVSVICTTKSLALLLALVICHETNYFRCAITCVWRTLWWWRVHMRQ